MWTKVYKILGDSRKPFVVFELFSIVNVSLRRCFPSSLEVVDKIKRQVDSFSTPNL